MNDIKRLLNSTMPLVKELLEKYGEFYPLASAIKINDSIAQVGTNNGDEKPLSKNLILEIKKALKHKKDTYKTIAIFYDITTVDPDTNVKIDAIAVFVENKNNDFAFTFYYPYTLKNKKLIFLDPWKSEIEKEIFND